MPIDDNYRRKNENETNLTIRDERPISKLQSGSNKVVYKSVLHYFVQSKFRFL